MNVGQMDEIKTVADLLKKEDLDVLKAYLQWNVINAASSYLSDAFYWLRILISTGRLFPVGRKCNRVGNVP